MIPYSEIKFLGNSYFIHGIPHTIPPYYLKKSYIESVRNFVESSIAKGENWYCEDGFNFYFKISAKRVKEFEKPNLISMIKNLLYLRNLKMKNEKRDLSNHRLVASMNLESIDDLIYYRKIFHPGVDLIISIMEFNSGIKITRYENLIKRCLKEIKQITNDRMDSHLLTGIAHEFVLKNIDWHLAYNKRL